MADLPSGACHGGLDEFAWRVVGPEEVSPALLQLMASGPPWCRFPDGIGCTSPDGGRCCWPPPRDRPQA